MLKLFIQIFSWPFLFSFVCLLLVGLVDSEPTMEETILVGDDLMMGPPSPFVPQEIASHVLDGVDKCDGILRNLFLCKCYSNDIFTIISIFSCTYSITSA